MPEDFCQSIHQSIEMRRSSVDVLAAQASTVASIVKTVYEALEGGGKILTCGNGGSAAEALHLAEELIGRFRADRRPLPAVCLAADPTALTCIANDYGFENVFARQVEALGNPGDVLVGLTTSGKSPNVIKAFEVARRKGVRVVGLLGRAISPAEAHCDIAFTPDLQNAAQIQELHLTVVHLILECLDESFGPAKS